MPTSHVLFKTIRSPHIHGQQHYSLYFTAHCSPPVSPASQQQTDDEHYMRLALQQAQAAYDADEVPIGAVIVCGTDVVSVGRNMTETRRNPLAHAELQCIMSAADRLQAWRLQDATLYCTVEPCAMCAGAILQARLQRLVYGARQPRLGADGSWVALFPAQPSADAGLGAQHGVCSAQSVVAVPLRVCEDFAASATHCVTCSRNVLHCSPCCSCRPSCSHMNHVSDRQDSSCQTSHRCPLSSCVSQ